MQIQTIPIWNKLNLTVEEAAQYSGIGENTLREYMKKHPECDFIIFIGKKQLIKRKEFEIWNSNQYVIK